mgnify:CR=1 FL=1|jgi:Flagellar biogenesis protein
METLFLALRVLVALGAVLGLIWFVQRKATRGGKKAAIASRLGGGGRDKRPIHVVGSHRLSAKASITVVEVDGVKLVLGVTEQGISVLEPAPAAPVVLATTPVGATVAEPAAIPGSDPTQVAASAEEALASADAGPAAVDFAAVLREALDEASTSPAMSTVVEAQARDEHVAKPRRRRMNVPALREQLVPHMTRTLASAIGIRAADAPSAPAEPTPASTPLAAPPTTSASSALAAFLVNSAPEAPTKKDYSKATPLAANLPVLQRAS